jgi:hypothetical protein
MLIKLFEKNAHKVKMGYHEPHPIAFGTPFWENFFRIFFLNFKIISIFLNFVYYYIKIYVKNFKIYVIFKSFEVYL